MMIIAELLDLAINDLHYFRADRRNFPLFRVGSVEERLGNAPAAVAGAHAQIATPIRKRSEFGLVRMPDLPATRTAFAVRTDNDRLFMIAGHHSFDVVAVKRVKV